MGIGQRPNPNTFYIGIYKVTNIRDDDFKVDLIRVVVKGISLLVFSGTTQDNFRDGWKFCDPLRKRHLLET